MVSVGDEAARLSRLASLRVLDSEREALFDALANAAALVAGTPIALISLIDHDRQWFKASVGLGNLTETPRDIAICDHAIRNEGVLMVCDVADDPRFAANPLVIGDPHIGFYAGAPLVLSDGSVVGALCVLDSTARPALSQAQLDSLSAIARAIAEALEQRAQARERSAAMKRQAIAENELAKDRTRLQAIIDGTRAGTFEWNIASGESRISERFAATLGYTRAELEPATLTSLRELVHADDLARSTALLEAHFAGASDFYECELRMRHRDGDWRWIASRGSVIERSDNGEPAWMFGTHTDVTARREAERRMHESEAFLDRTGRVAGVGGWEFDLTTDEIVWSDQTCRIHDLALGYRPVLAEAVGFYAPDAQKILNAAIENAISTGAGWDLELPLVTAKKRPIWVRAVGAVEYDQGKPVRLIGAVQDVTARRLMTESLLASERRFRNLFEFSRGMICTHDLEGNILTINPAAAESLGYERESVIGKPITAFMHPDAIGGFARYLQRIAANGRDTGLLRLIANDGSARTWQYSNVIDEDGDRRYVLGHAEDITEREREQRALRDLSVRDPLTGCFNRRYLSQLDAAARADDAWSCIAIDLVRFKQVNDNFGHQRGDAVLIEIAAFLMQHVRPHDVVVRMGGDEFVVLLRDTEEKLAAQVADRLNRNRAAAPIGFTFGAATRTAGEALEATIARADHALYTTRSCAQR